jgi:hypothetical protein
MVVAVVDEIIRDGMTVAGVEFLEEGLGGLRLLVAKLLDEAVGLNLSVISHLTEVEVRKDRLDGIELVRTDWCLSWLTVLGVNVDVNPGVPDPFLGGLWNTRVTGSNS